MKIEKEKLILALLIMQILATFIFLREITPYFSVAKIKVSLIIFCVLIIDIIFIYRYWQKFYKNN